MAQRRLVDEVRFWLALAVLLLVGCGSIGPGPSPVGPPLTEPQLKFAVLDAAGKPAYCDPDLWPLARPEMPNAIARYPAIKADEAAYAAIVAHEHLPSGDLTDDQKLVVYRAWKLLQALALNDTGGGYSFDYRVATATGRYEMVTGTVRVDGVVSVASRTPTGAPMCPICLAASTMIATPTGPVRVTDIREGTTVWTETSAGERVAEPVIAVGSMAVPPGHLMAHLVMADGRQLLVSPGHKTADGRPAGTLKSGDRLDGSVIKLWELVPYAGDRTYDLLPAGRTGVYWADGILMSSTLSLPLS